MSHAVACLNVPAVNRIAPTKCSASVKRAGSAVSRQPVPALARSRFLGESVAIAAPLSAKAVCKESSLTARCAYISVAPPPKVGYFPSATGMAKGKIAVMVEEHFDPFEYRSYNDYYTKAGYDVEYVSYLWGQPHLVFTSNPNESVIEESVLVHACVSKVQPTDYAAILVIGAYATDRLRYQPAVWKGKKNDAPAVEFCRKALKANVLTGHICHSLWLFCADPDMLKGRRVTCAHNIVPDVENAGGNVVYEGEGTAEIVVDLPLVCGKHPGMLPLFNETFGKQLEAVKR
eukprot:jgi/Mesvir1/7112/Mv09216-RA.1